MKVKQLTPNEHNPRTISDAKLTQLKKALLKFGDLSGIVYNRKSKQLVCGHQRTKHFGPDSDITITKQYSKPTKTGTVAEGFAIFNGERFNYREVSWDAHTEKAANIAANNNAGEWNLPQLGEWLKELSSFDVDLDLDLTMFDEKDRAKLFPKAAKELVNSSTEVDLEGISRLTHECPKCGFCFNSGKK